MQCRNQLGHPQRCGKLEQQQRAIEKAVSAVFFVLAEPMVRAIPAMVALTAGSSAGLSCFAHRCA
jgi:hypothetical protein